jgi:hypothetical protein
MLSPGHIRQNSKWRLSLETSLPWKWVKSMSSYGVVSTINESLAMEFDDFNIASMAARDAIKLGYLNTKVRLVESRKRSSGRSKFLPAGRSA